MQAEVSNYFRLSEPERVNGRVYLWTEENAGTVLDLIAD